MKAKVQPEDFVVREESRVPLSPGPDRYRVYRLAKSRWDTFDLVDRIARRLRLPRKDISFGGIKDRHGRTEQLLSIRADGRPLPGLEEAGFSLEPLGWAPGPITAKDIRGNRFTVVLRDIDERRMETLLAACGSIRRQGVPNYYDEQRFGSARHGKGFMGREVFLGHREKALRLYFQPAKQDDPRTRALKHRVIEHWGRWQECLEPAFNGAFGEYRRILEYLDGHRIAYTRALGLIDRKFLMFVLNAYQSYLFNEVLAGTLRRLPAQEERDGSPAFRLAEVPWQYGRFLFYDRLPEELFERCRELELPVPGYDTEPPPPADGMAGAAAAALEEALEREGIALRDLKARQLRGIDVKGSMRRVLVLPEDFAAGDVREDELYPGKRRITLEFFLPRGAYATLLIKRLEAEETLRGPARQGA